MMNKWTDVGAGSLLMGLLRRFDFRGHRGSPVHGEFVIFAARLSREFQVPSGNNAKRLIANEITRLT